MTEKDRTEEDRTGQDGARYKYNLTFTPVYLCGPMCPSDCHGHGIMASATTMIVFTVGWYRI